MGASHRTLRRRGYPQADIELARVQQDAERRAGSAVRSLAAVLAGKPARPQPDAAAADLTARQLRRRGHYGQAALLADQGALIERDPERATEARRASLILKELAQSPAQSEMSFFMGNVSTGIQYHDAIRERLMATPATPAERAAARSVLMEIVRWLGWQSYACEKNAAELAELLAMDRGHMTRTLNLLESVGAITRVKRGQMKVITITPEGAFRGNLERHAETVSRYRAEVLPLRRPRAPDDDPPAAA